MHSTIENEKVVRSPTILRGAITRIDETRRGGIAAMGKTLASALRRRLRRAAVARKLAALDDHMLADIGIERWQIAEVADWAALEPKAGVRPGRAAAGTPFLRTAGRFVRDRAVAPILRAYRRQVAYRQLSALDDRLLKDIGLTRGEIPTLVRALSERERHREDQARIAREAGTEGRDMLRSLRLWYRSRSAAKTLHTLDDRMLTDIGLVRGDVDEVAEELALRSLCGPAANCNEPSEAA